ncbi:hypothetical protein ST47_g1261 [Ascochyta rabiei]|uniref:Uncharacterized protein n=1 Tax=Didymella rabiei TaxID=5454 RepID=A0A163LCC1_DIDRA|nr:hypothetical protein ST47_g1261 [Ascochyta rabiei]
MSELSDTGHKNTDDDQHQRNQRQCSRTPVRQDQPAYDAARCDRRIEDRHENRLRSVHSVARRIRERRLKESGSASECRTPRRNAECDHSEAVTAAAQRRQSCGKDHQAQHGETSKGPIDEHPDHTDAHEGEKSEHEQDDSQPIAETDAIQKRRQIRVHDVVREDPQERDKQNRSYARQDQDFPHRQLPIRLLPGKVRHHREYPRDQK